MHLPPWFWFAAIVLVSWGIVGLLQKLSTNYLPAEDALIWLVVGFLILQPLLIPGASLSSYRSMTWTLLAAMRSGGKASVVATLTALYPPVVALAAPIVSVIPGAKNDRTVTPINRWWMPFVTASGHSSPAMPPKSGAGLRATSTASACPLHPDSRF